MSTSRIPMEIERARGLKQSSDWESVKKVLDGWIGSCEQQLRTCNAHELQHLQSSITTLEKVKMLPEIVIDMGE